MYGQGSFEPEGCPDWDASHHSTCGTFHYRGQPDDWLNEEWWGVVALVPCAATEPTVRPRRLFYELKLLWRLGGGCVVQHNATGIAPPYEATAYPRCGEATATAAASVSEYMLEAFYIDDGPMVTSFSLLPGAAALMPPEARSPGSLTHLLGVQLNHTAALLAELRGAVDPVPRTENATALEATALEAAQLRMPTLVAAIEPPSARGHSEAALWRAYRLFGSAACLAQLADSFLRDLETDGCPYQDYVACLDPGACPRRTPVIDDLGLAVVDMEAYLQRQRAGQTAGDCPPASPPPAPPLDPPVAPLPPTSPAPLQRVLRGNRMSVYGRELRLDGEAWMMRGICYSPVPVEHDPGYP